MAHYDKDTKKFMDEVAPERTLKSQLVHSTRAVAKQVARGKPLSEALARQAIVLPTFAALEKQGAQAIIKILDIFKLLNSHYDHDWWEWEPETIWQTLERDHDIEPSEAVRNIVQALQMVVKTDGAFEHWHLFEKIGQAFNWNPVHFGSMQPLEPDEAALTIQILQTIRPKTEFDDEVCAYLAACAKNAGMVYLPPEYFPARAQVALDGMHNNMELKAEVMSKAQSPDPESPLSVQRQRLQTLVEYVQGAL